MHIPSPTEGYKPRRFNNTMWGKSGWTLGKAHHNASQYSLCIGRVMRGNSDPTHSIGSAHAQCAAYAQRGRRYRRSVA
jgi:hypothetical protein